jgi:hypothetical protein
LGLGAGQAFNQGGHLLTWLTKKLALHLALIANNFKLMTGQDIINKFEVQTDDSTELSSQEELDLANKVLRFIYDFQAWEFLRKKATGTVAAAGIVVPADFLHCMVNYSEDMTSALPDTAVVYLGGSPYKVIPMGARNSSPLTNVCWYNPSNRTIEFKTSMAGQAYEFDYKYLPVDITVSTEPILPTSHYIVVYGMLIDDDVIQKTDKGRSNIVENTNAFNQQLSNLKSYNSKLFFI